MLIINDIIEATGGVLFAGSPAGKIRGVSIDSRTIPPGEIYVAIKGEHFDGHRFVEQALEKGAAGAVVSRRVRLSKPLAGSESRRDCSGPVLIRVPDTVKALGEIAALKRRDFSGRLAAVTGSNGKTTTKDMLADVSAKKFSVLRSEGNKNNHIGVPLTLLRLKKEHGIAVVEMGMNHRGELKNLARMTRPNVAVITGVGRAHLGYLKTPAAIARAKCELLEEMEPGDAGVINADHFRLVEEARRFDKIRLITFGIKTDAEFTADRIACGWKGLTFRVNKKWTLTMNLLGAHNVYNALAAWSAASVLGISPGKIREALKSFRPPEMRMELLNANGVTIINDAYNSNPESFDFAIDTVTSLNGGGRKVLMAGDMLELGEKSGILHRRLGRHAARAGIDVLVAVGDYSGATGEGAVKAGMNRRRVFVFRRRKTAERLLLREVRRGDIILIKGSRKMEMEKAADCLLRYLGKGSGLTLLKK